MPLDILLIKRNTDGTKKTVPIQILDSSIFAVDASGNPLFLPQSNFASASAVQGAADAAASAVTTANTAGTAATSAVSAAEAAGVQAAAALSEAQSATSAASSAANAAADAQATADSAMSTAGSAADSATAAAFVASEAKTIAENALSQVSGTQAAEAMALAEATATALSTHEANQGNPHNVSKTQVGLPNVLNVEQIPVTEKGVANGVATLGPDAKVLTSQLPAVVVGAMAYQGVWDALTNDPELPAAAAENKGQYWKVSVAGSTDISGVTDWKIGDMVVSNGESYDKIDNTQEPVGVGNVVGLTDALAAKADLTDVRFVGVTGYTLTNGMSVTHTVSNSFSIVRIVRSGTSTFTLSGGSIGDVVNIEFSNAGGTTHVRFGSTTLKTFSALRGSVVVAKRSSSLWTVVSVTELDKITNVDFPAQRFTATATIKAEVKARVEIEINGSESEGAAWQVYSNDGVSDPKNFTYELDFNVDGVNGDNIPVQPASSSAADIALALHGMIAAYNTNANVTLDGTKVIIEGFDSNTEIGLNGTNVMGVSPVTLGVLRSSSLTGNVVVTDVTMFPVPGSSEFVAADSILIKDALGNELYRATPTAIGHAKTNSLALVKGTDPDKAITASRYALAGLSPGVDVRCETLASPTSGELEVTVAGFIL